MYIQIDSVSIVAHVQKTRANDQRLCSVEACEHLDSFSEALEHQDIKKPSCHLTIDTTIAVVAPHV